MADSDKNILITPNIGSTTSNPNIVFTGGDNNPITLSVLGDGTLSFTGSSGQLFSVSDSLTGTIFSVNDVSGIPSIEVDDDGTVRIAEFAGNLLIGTSVDNGYKLQVSSNISMGDGTGESYLKIGDQVADDNSGSWNKGVHLNALNHGRYRIRTTNLTYGALETYYWADSSVSPSMGIYGNTSTFKFTGSITTLQNKDGQSFIHSGNIGSQSVASATTATTATSAGKWTTARTNTVTLTGDVTGTGSASVDGTGNWTVSLSTAVGNDSHTHAFNNLTEKTSGTGDYATTGDIVSGKGSGGVALTVNDGKGNANITWNHQDGTPEQNGNAARIEVNTDSTSNASMYFELKSNVTSGVNVDLTPIMRLTETAITAESGISFSGDGSSLTNVDAATLDGLDSAENGNSVILKTASNGYLNIDNWIQVGSTTGLYNSTGHYLYPDATYGWRLRNGGSTTTASISLDNSAGSRVGWVYANDTGQGFLTTGGSWRFRIPASGSLQRDGTYTIWDSGNDGSGSGLDADLLDGQHGSYYYPASNPSGYTTNTGTVIEGGTTFNGTYPLVVRVSANNIYSHPDIEFTGSSSTLAIAGNTVWHAGNDGSGSGLDADLLDGQHGSYYAPISSLGNYVLKTGDTMTGNLTYTGLIGPATSDRDKIRVYSSSLYAIGMQSAITYGGLNDWAMTFQFNNESDRGFWWGHDGHTTAQGAMSLTTTGHLFVGSRVDAPVFYDSNNTSYYADFSSANRSINVAGGIHQTETHRPNVQWSSTGTSTGSVLITLPGTSSQYDMVSIEIDVYEYNSTAGSKIYISGHNWTSGWFNNSVQVVGAFNKPIYLGRDGSDYFIQLGDVGSTWAYGTVNVTQVTTAGFYSVIDWAVGWNIGLVTTLPTYLQVTGNYNDSGDATLKTNGYIYSPSSVRSPIFYDSDDTAYYVDPNSRSRLLSLTTRNRISIGSNGLLPYEDTGEAGIWYSGTSSNATWFLGLNGATTSADFRFYAGANRFLFTQGGTGTATADWRAPIFYDSNNTAYYANPASTSQFNVIDANGLAINSGDGQGIGFWNGSGGSNYSIYMSSTGNGTHGGRVSGETTSDYNMYFKMNGGTNRGFVFRSGTTNVAGIDSTGTGYFPQLRFGGLNPTVEYDFDGTGATNAADSLAYLKFGSGISTGTNLAAVECISPSWSAISGVTYADNKFRIMSARGSAEDALKAAVNLSTVNGEGDTTIIGNVNIDGTNTRLVSGIGISGLDVYVVGDLIGSGDITAYSDERLKENIETLDGSKVYEMRGVSFTKDGKAGSGVVAQELEKVAPELVHDSGEYKSVAYGNLVGYLIEAVKELKAEVDDLKAQLAQEK